jgi:ribosome recycling factor
MIGTEIPAHWSGSNMSADDILLDAEDRMEKAIGVLKHSLAGIRTGRANPGLVDSLRVDGTIKDIERAIIASDLGFNPQSDGRLIRIVIPPLSTEVRKKMVARIKELAEETKVSIRNIRRDANKAAEQAEKDKSLTEDLLESAKEDIQELTKRFEGLVTDLAKARELEVMEN